MTHWTTKLSSHYCQLSEKSATQTDAAEEQEQELKTPQSVSDQNQVFLDQTVLCTQGVVLLNTLYTTAVFSSNAQA